MWKYTFIISNSPAYYYYSAGRRANNNINCGLSFISGTLYLSSVVSIPFVKHFYFVLNFKLALAKTTWTIFWFQVWSQLMTRPSPTRVIRACREKYFYKPHCGFKWRHFVYEGFWPQMRKVIFERNPVFLLYMKTLFVPGPNNVV